MPRKKKEDVNIDDVVKDTAEEAKEINKIDDPVKQDKELTEMTEEVRAEMPDERGHIETREIDGEMKEVRVCGGEPPVIPATVPHPGEVGFINEDNQVEKLDMGVMSDGLDESSQLGYDERTLVNSEESGQGSGVGE